MNGNTLFILPVISVYIKCSWVRMSLLKKKTLKTFALYILAANGFICSERSSRNVTMNSFNHAMPVGYITFSAGYNSTVFLPFTGNGTHTTTVASGATVLVPFSQVAILAALVTLIFNHVQRGRWTSDTELSDAVNFLQLCTCKCVLEAATELKWCRNDWWPAHTTSFYGF